MAVTTHSFKYKPTTAPSGTEDRVLACSHTTDDCHCVINASGQIGYYVSGVFTQIGTATVSLNEQYSFIIEHDDAGNGCIYLNGQKIGCATNFPTTAINQIGNFKTELKPETGRKPKVGLKPRTVSNIYARPCCGVIDEYARFNRALSASEVVDLSQSGTLSKVYTLADYKIALMADDGIIATTEKPRYKENWRSIWNADQRTSALPTAIASITVNGSYKSLATSANDAGIWTPTTNGTPAYDYYQAVESWRQMFFVSSGGGTGFLLTANLAGDSDISSMSPTLEARQSALMFAEDALRSAVMIKRQLTAESVANGKTTLYSTLASAKLAAKSGDQFFYNSDLYVCTADLAATARRYTTKAYGNSATAPVQTTQTVSGCVLTEPLNYGDTYFNTTTKKFYTYTTSWVEDTATGNLVIAYAPKYLGRYYQSHPGAPNNGDWWLVYGVASSPITRGFWYNNNGTNTLVSTLGTEAQRKYKGSGLEDVLYASNNGYALTSGGVYDPVAIYGVSVMEFLAVNQAFIEKLFAQNITLLSGGSIKSSNYDTKHGFNIDGDTGRLTGRDLRLGETGAFMTTENGTFADGVGYTTGNYDAPANGDLLMSMNGAATFLGLIKTPILALCQRVLGIWNLRLAIYQHLFGTRIVATKSDGITEIGSIDFNDRSSPNGMMLIKATERMQLQTGAGLNMATTDSQSSFFKEVYSNTIAPVNWFPTNQHSDAYPIMTMGKVLDGSISFLVPNNNTYTRAARLNVGQYGTSKEVNVSVKLNKTGGAFASWNIAVTDGITESYFSGELAPGEQTTTVTVNRICTFNYLEVYVALSGSGSCTAISTFTAYAPNTTGVTLVN